jgi:hypothetical protein
MVQLTPEQQEQVRRAKEAEDRRVVLTTTPEQVVALRQAIAKEDAAMAESKADAIRRHAAQIR